MAQEPVVAQRGECESCHRLYQVTGEGLVRLHREHRGGATCPGALKMPVKLVEARPPTVA